jgi:hypothetical protein
MMLVAQRARQGAERVWKGYGRVRKGFVVMCRKDLFPELSLAQEQLSFLVRRAVSERVLKDLFPEWSLAATLCPGSS